MLQKEICYDFKYAYFSLKSKSYIPKCICEYFKYLYTRIKIMSVHIYKIIKYIQNRYEFFFKSVSKKIIQNRYVPDLVYYEVTHDTVIVTHITSFV